MNILVNDDLSLFLIGGKSPFRYICSPHIHKLFIDGNKGRMILSVLIEEKELIDGYWHFMDIMKMHCGRRDDYMNGVMFARFSNCKIKQQWLEDIVTRSPEYTEVAKCYFYIKFDIDTINWQLQ